MPAFATVARVLLSNFSVIYSPLGQNNFPAPGLSDVGILAALSPSPLFGFFLSLSFLATPQSPKGFLISRFFDSLVK